jgi:DNA invertase Pin-like site-specific DNA recombinase
MTTRAYSYIRFSTPEQAKGSSLERQLEASMKYAEAHGLLLDDKLVYRDLGLQRAAPLPGS